MEKDNLIIYKNKEGEAVVKWLKYLMFKYDNIFEEGELDKNPTVSKIEIVCKEGNRTVTREIEFYNLDAIIAVGYRVNSRKATEFRIWANIIY